jgi:hypothetical protein
MKGLVVMVGGSAGFVGCQNASNAMRKIRVPKLIRDCAQLSLIHGEVPDPYNYGEKNIPC